MDSTTNKAKASEIVDSKISASEKQSPVDIGKLISEIETKAKRNQLGHLGVGDFDKLLTAKVNEHINYVPEVDTKVRMLIAASVKRYEVHIAENK
jgi:hypothetical protein